MKIKIIHKITYNYSEPVFLEPHYIRLTPFSDMSCKVVRSKIIVKPKPSMVYPVIEHGGCTSYVASFMKKTEKLDIEHTSEVRLTEKNPFNFLISPSSFGKLPYPEGVHKSPELMPYLERSVLSDEVSNSAYEELYSSSDNTINFLSKLASDINKNIPYLDRETGNAFDPEVTMKNGGSCRDKTLLFIDICRSLNIPSRYVSGYPIKLDEKTEEIDSGYHAWAEVFIPGAGWVGYDPTIGIICYGFHVKLATSPYHQMTLPASGTFRGTASSTIQYKVKFIKK